MEPALAQKIASLPDAPGVYLMKDRAGRVLYVGKARSLRARVRSYFAGEGDGRPFVASLERLLGDVETLLVDSDKEALLLEAELVRRHRPRFNVQLQGGRNFIYLRLDTRRPWPRLEVVRQVQRDGARYFGPYPAATALRETLRVVNRAFQLRTCADHAEPHRRRPCLLCRIARFPTPSVYDIPPDEYRRHVDDAIRFLEGRRGELLADLRARMERAAAALLFEEAARLRDRIAAVERTLEPQKVALAEPLDLDAIGAHHEGDRLVFYVLHVRRGRVIGGEAFPSEMQRPVDPEGLASFVNLYYAPGRLIPDEVLLPLATGDAPALAALLTERRGDAAPVRVSAPQRGPRRRLLRLATRNAAHAFHEKWRAGEGAALLLERLRERLGLRRTPRRIECFDVSCFQDDRIVASRVAMTDGALDKERYRRYRLRRVAWPDDTASMYEVVSRRVFAGRRDGDLPDLILVDGGKGQLGAALAALADQGAAGAVDLAALAKDPDRLFVPGRRDPVELAPSAPELLLLARLRDEAHRFAFTYHDRLARRGALRSALDEIPGIGEVRRRRLLARFGSLPGIRAAGDAELAEVVGPALARRVREALDRGGQGAAAAHPD